jgi:hypothetical protein
VSEETEEQKVLGDIKIDTGNLYREEVVTDLRVASIRCLTPILVDGSDDTSRSRLFMGETQLMSARGPLPIQCPIQAQTLEEAIDAFPEAVNTAVEQMIEEAKEIQRQEASRIVVPGQPTGLGKIIPG